MLSGKRKNMLNDNRKLIPRPSVLLSLLLAAAEASLVFLCVREAFRTKGNIRPDVSWVMLLAFILTFLGMIAGGVSMGKRDTRPFFPVVGLVFNILVFLVILAVYALGF